MTNFSKNPQKFYFGAILDPFCPNLGKNEFSWKKKSFQFLDISILPLYQKSEKTNEPLLRKTPN